MGQSSEFESLETTDDIKAINFHVLTIFPEMFHSPFNEGITSKAIKNGIVNIFLHDIRVTALDKHRTVDDYPFGGGPGMLFKPEPIFNSVEAVKQTYTIAANTPTILLSPQGQQFTHQKALELSKKSDLILICGRYEGFDERIREKLATEEISIGDFVLSGGEIAAMSVIDAVSRLVPNVVGSKESTENDSFSEGLLQFPQYTRPANFRGMRVPNVLLSGDHNKIREWRRRESLLRTFRRRPDLSNKITLTENERALVCKYRTIRSQSDTVVNPSEPVQGES